MFHEMAGYHCEILEGQIEHNKQVCLKVCREDNSSERDRQVPIGGEEMSAEEPIINNWQNPFPTFS